MLSSGLKAARTPRSNASAEGLANGGAARFISRSAVESTVGAGKKSLTLTLEFRDPGRTLKSEEVDAQMKAALDLLTATFHAVLRA